jgi:hypothetical protein
MRKAKIALGVIVTLAAGIAPALAWEVNWVNSQRVHYSVENHSKYALVVKSLDYKNITLRPRDLLVDPTSNSQSADFVLFFPYGDSASLKLEVRRFDDAKPDKICDIPLSTNVADGTRTITNFAGAPTPGANCSLKLKDDSKDKTSFIIVVYGATKPY